jgi:hypothetical protein
MGVSESWQCMHEDKSSDQMNATCICPDASVRNEHTCGFQKTKLKCVKNLVYSKGDSGIIGLYIIEDDYSVIILDTYFDIHIW